MARSRVDQRGDTGTPCPRPAALELDLPRVERLARGAPAGGRPGPSTIGRRRARTRTERGRRAARRAAASAWRSRRRVAAALQAPARPIGLHQTRLRNAIHNAGAYVAPPRGQEERPRRRRAGLRHRQGRRWAIPRSRWRRRWPPRAPAAASSRRGRPGRPAPPLCTAPSPRARARGEPQQRLASTTIDPVAALEEWAGRQPARAGSSRPARSNASRPSSTRRPGARERAAITKAWELGAARAPVKGTPRRRPRRRRRPFERRRRRHAADPAHVRRDRARRPDRLSGAQGRRRCWRTRRQRASRSPFPPSRRSARRSTSRNAWPAPSGARSTRWSSTACGPGASALRRSIA